MFRDSAILSNRGSLFDHHQQSMEDDSKDGTRSLELDRQSCVSALTTDTMRRNQQESPSSATSTPVANGGKTQSIIYGRKQELDQIIQAFRRITKPKAQSEVVLLHGMSGVGKTCIAEHLRFPISRRGGFFVSGKCDSSTSVGQSYPAIVEALTDLCDLIAQRKGFGKAKQHKILHQIGARDALRLSHLLGNLHRITGDMSRIAQLEEEDDDDDDEGSITSTISTSQRQILLQWSMQKFLRACTSAKHPLCLFLDDLQYSDRQSLQLLRSLVQDGMSRNVLFLFVYRDTPMIRNDLLAMDPTRTTVTDIVVHNLSLEATHSILTAKLQVGGGGTADASEPDSTATLELAELVIRKTHALPGCIFLFLEQLQRDQLLWQQEDGTWAWDIGRIQAETDVTDNVAELITLQVLQTHKYVQLILKVAAAIGCEFHRKLLETVIVAECVASSSSSSASVHSFQQKIHKYLGIALKDNLIEKTGSPGRYKFAHSRVKEAVYELIPEGSERTGLHFRIGQCLRAMLSQKEEPEEWMTFAAAEQFNRAGVDQSLDAALRLEIMIIMIRAGKLAHSRDVYVSAQEFFQGAQRMMDAKELFEQHYELAMELYTFAAESNYAVGDFARCEIDATTIMVHAKYPDDKMRIIRTLVDALDSQGQWEKGIQVTLDLLKEFGESFPSKPKATTVILELMRTHKLLATKTDTELIFLPEISDEQKLNTLELLSVLGTMTPLVGTETISMLSALGIIQRSLTDGVAASISPYAYALFGKAMAMIGHTQEAFRYGNVALEMLKRFQTHPSIQAHTIAVVHGTCRHWRTPLKESLKPLMQAYEHGMIVGDIKFSFLAASDYLVASMESGVSLSQVEVDMRTFCEGLDDMMLGSSSNTSNNTFRTIIAPIWQQVLCLMGQTTENNPVLMVGAAMNEKVYLDDEYTHKCVGAILAYTKAKLALAYHFDNLRLAEQLTEELDKDDEQMLMAHFSVYQVQTYCCLTNLHLTELTGKRKYRNNAFRIIKKLELWMQDGNPNCRPFVLLLRAEYMAIATAVSASAMDSGDSKGSSSSSSSKAIVHKLFDSAIECASDAGLIHVQALCHERAAMAWLRTEDFREGIQDILAARDLYFTWGALAKCQYLERKFHMYFLTSKLLKTTQE